MSPAPWVPSEELPGTGSSVQVFGTAGTHPAGSGRKARRAWFGRFSGQTGQTGHYGRNPRSNLLWDPGSAGIHAPRRNPAELPGHGQFVSGWPTTSTHPALSLKRGVHGLREVPDPCKYGMLFDGIRVPCFGQKASMKPRGGTAGLRFHAPSLRPLGAITGHNGPYGQNPSPILLWVPGLARYDVPWGRRNGASAPLRH